MARSRSFVAPLHVGIAGIALIGVMFIAWLSSPIPSVENIGTNIGNYVQQ